MRQFLNFLFFSVLLIFIFSCDSEDEELVSSTDYSSYLCPAFEIDDNRYGSTEELRYHVKVVVVNNAKFYKKEAKKILESQEHFGGVNIKFKFSRYSYIDTKDSIPSFKDYLRMNNEIGVITLLVFPDNTIFLEDKGSFTLGASSGIPTLSNVSRGKPVLFVRSSVSKTPIVAHEFGHVFGLEHTFYGDDMTNKGLNCGSGDKVPDTVTPMYAGAIGTKSCTYYAPEGWEEFYSELEIENLVVNTMSYSPYVCMKGFTLGQQQKIRKMISINPILQSAEYGYKS